MNCAELLRSFSYSIDVRKVPDDRRGSFKKGWSDATIRCVTYSENSLEQLTWTNLGYRLGKLFGTRSIAEIEVYFEQFATHYRETDGGQSFAYSSPDEVEETVYREGAVRTVVVNAYERNSNARQRCIENYGALCFVCQFDFRAFYGEAGTGYIHVHHLRQLSSIGEEYELDPIADLRPVCPNCHAIIHRRTPAYSIEEVVAMLEQTQSLRQRAFSKAGTRQQ